MAVKMEIDEVLKRCDCALIKVDDLRSSVAVREDDLNDMIGQFEAKTKELDKSNHDLHNDVGVDWEVAVDAKDFDQVRDALFNMAVKSTKKAVHEKFSDLDLDFLKTQDDVVEDTHNETAN